MSKVMTFNLGNANAFLIRDKGVILVDTGVIATTEKYQRLFSAMGINPREIKLIIISHGHTDHFAHLYELKELTGAPVLCHKNAVHALQTGRNPIIVPRTALGKNVYSVIQGKVPIVQNIVEPDIIIDSMFDLNPYGVAGKIIHTPGHSDCSVTVLLDSGEAIVGDLIVPSPFTGEACAAYLANDEQALFANIRMLLDHAHIFYVGHGGPYTREEIIKLV